MSGAFKDRDEIDKYVALHFPDVTETFLKEQVVKYCPTCQVKIAFAIQLYHYVKQGAHYPTRPFIEWPYSIILRCPACGSIAVWLLYNVPQGSEARIYRLLSLPMESGIELPELPPDPPALCKAYNEAIRSLEAGNPMAAVVMFRRTLQIITQDILGAPRSKLHQELDWLTRNDNALGQRLSKNFHNNAFIIKESANQGAHPDEDPDLLVFTDDDAQAIYELFLEVVHEVFSIPEAKQEAVNRLMARRKIQFPSSTKTGVGNPGDVPPRTA